MVIDFTRMNKTERGDYINSIWSINQLIKHTFSSIYLYKDGKIIGDKLNKLENAVELSNLLSGMNCYINLIPYNPTDNLGFNRSKTIQIMRFYDILKKNKINVTIRKEFGSKVDAACGQLRANQNIGG